jgi:hypothetical protein
MLRQLKNYRESPCGPFNVCVLFRTVYGFRSLLIGLLDFIHSSTLTLWISANTANVKRLVV